MSGKLLDYGEVVAVLPGMSTTSFHQRRAQILHPGFHGSEAFIHSFSAGASH